MELSVPLDLPALVDLLETEACLDCLDLLDLLDPEALLVLKEREEMQDQLGKKDLQVKNFNIFFHLYKYAVQVLMDPRDHLDLLVLAEREVRRVHQENKELLA